MTIYPEQLATIGIYIAALNQADQEIEKLEHKVGLIPMLDRIPVMQDGDLIGWLVDEVGGTWSFTARVVGDGA